MSLLRLKSFVYRLTGIFLASKEQLEYIESDQYWESFNSLLRQEGTQHEYYPQFIHGILVGTWQADHGFTRPSRCMKPTH